MTPLEPRWVDGRWTVDTTRPGPDAVQAALFDAREEAGLFDPTLDDVE